MKLEEQYTTQWKNEFEGRLKTGRFIQRVLMDPFASKVGFSMARIVPSIVPKIIKKTHGTKAV